MAVVLVSAMQGCSDDDNVNPVTDGGNPDTASPFTDSGGEGGGGEGGTAPIACADLVGFEVAATAIGLPTSGAVVTAAVDMAADGAALPAHCLVSGNIMPVDPTAPNIEFNVALPTTWNQKIIFLGGGGFDGSIPDVTAQVPNSTPTALSPLARGYAVFADDGGHESTATVGFADATTFVNDEAYKNWLSDAPKKTRDAAQLIIQAHYGQTVLKAYAAGGSTGGREVLADVGRFGADWDGAIAYYPGRDAVVGILGYANLNQQMATAFVNPAKRNVVWQAVLAACDALDGATDGIVANVTACKTAFDPSVTRCAGGTDTGDTCLSDAQLAALASINAPVTFNVTMPTGETDFPGFNVYLGQNGGSTASTEPTVEAFSLGLAAPTYPVSATTAPSGMFADGFFRYAVTRDPNFNYLTLDVHGFGSAAARVAAVSALDSQDTDLSAFAAKGGKLLMVQGTADMLVPAPATERYVTTMTGKVGAATADTFFRYYEVAGFQHGVSSTYQHAWDSLTALENWVEKGTDPAENEVSTDLIGVPVRTRPLCRYPAYPKYSGAGDMNDAKSFTCFK